MVVFGSFLKAGVKFFVKVFSLRSKGYLSKCIETEDALAHGDVQ